MCSVEKCLYVLLTGWFLAEKASLKQREFLPRLCIIFQGALETVTVLDGKTMHFDSSGSKEINSIIDCTCGLYNFSIVHLNET